MRIWIFFVSVLFFILFSNCNDSEKVTEIDSNVQLIDSSIDKVSMDGLNSKQKIQTLETAYNKCLTLRMIPIKKLRKFMRLSFAYYKLKSYFKYKELNKKAFEIAILIKR